MMKLEANTETWKGWKINDETRGKYRDMERVEDKNTLQHTLRFSICLKEMHGS
jgi:hypothetical protein